MARPVEALSDDESQAQAVVCFEGGAPIQRPVSSEQTGFFQIVERPQSSSSKQTGVKRKASKEAKVVSPHEIRCKLVRVLNSTCRCAVKSTAKVKRTSCFSRFKNLLDQLLELRIRLAKLHKLDADKLEPCLNLLTVFPFGTFCSLMAPPYMCRDTIRCLLCQVCNLLGAPPSKLKLLGREVCAPGFGKLLGLGSGRLRKLRAASAEGKVPMDGRFIRAEKSKAISQSRQIVFEFLEEIYNTMAEPMPEASEPAAMRQMSFRRRRGRRPKIAAAQSRLKLEKKQQDSMKLLPPGTYTDYLQLLIARRRPPVPISLKLFSAATEPHL